MKKTDRSDLAGPADHLANERTFLSWIRTSIAIMGLGFVVVKFALFMMQITAVLGHTPAIIPAKTYSGHLGVALVAIGLCAAFYAYYQYCFREKQLRSGEFSATRLPALLLTAGILVIGMLLFSYLLNGI